MPFDKQPTLAGDRLLLRPLRAEDYDEIYGAASDPLIWEQHPANDRHQPAVFRALFDESLASGGALVAIDRATGRMIGWSRYHGYEEAASEVEIGWTFLARAYWGGVYNGEMKRLMLAHAFAAVRTVLFVVGTGNVRSQRAVEKLGATRRAGIRVNANGGESYVYELTAAIYRPAGAQTAP
jgi:RimJ/RimL family protein N-acetyltransferase